MKKMESMQSDASFSVVIPVFNEDYYVKRSVLQAIEEMESLGVDFEVIVVDDGSIDGTYDALRKITRQDDRVKVLQNYTNLNVGISLLRGFHFAEKEFVLNNSIDLCYDMTHLKEVLPLLDKSDVVVIERKNRGKIGANRRIMTFMNIFLIKLLFHTTVQSYNFIQVYRREWLETVTPRILSRSPGFAQAELIIRAIKTGARVKRAWSEVRPREMGKSHFGKPHDMIWPFYEMLRFRIRTFGDRY